MKNSERMYQSVLLEKHEQFKSVLLSLLDAMSNNDQSKKIEENKRANKVSKEFASILAESERPGWLTKTMEATRKFAIHNPDPSAITAGSSWALLKELVVLYPEVMSHVWVWSNDEDAPVYRFDNVFELARNNSKLTELFDAMIASLEHLLATGEIDSLRAIESLKKLIATLSQNKNGSYFSTIASWRFAKTFTKNVVWKSLENIPGVQTAKAAFEKTLEDMDIKMDDLHKEISVELSRRCGIEVTDKLAHHSNNPLYIGDVIEGERADV